MSYFFYLAKIHKFSEIYYTYYIYIYIYIYTHTHAKAFLLPEAQKFLILVKSHLSILSVVAFVAVGILVSYLPILCPIQVHEDLPLCFFLRVF